MASTQQLLPRVAIVGAGPSAVYALKRLIAADRPLAVTIFEAGQRPGVGTPYDRAQNSPAMLANIASIELPPVRETLLEWLKSIPKDTLLSWGIEDRDLHERHFFPRVVLGDYFAAQFSRLLSEGKKRGHRLDVYTNTQVTDIVAHEHGVWITTGARHNVADEFDQAILATGHSAPRPPCPDIRRPALEPGNLDALAGNRRLGILGTSLSAIDVAIDHALRLGRFVSEGARLSFEPSVPFDKGGSPLITMMSRGGLLSEADFYCPIPYEPLELFTLDRLERIVAGEDGDLDSVFAVFVEQLDRLDPAFRRSLGDDCMTPESFAERYSQRRSPYEPFEWARFNLLEVMYNARNGRTVPWRYALLRMHEPFGGIVKYLSDNDRSRFNNSLKRVFVDNYAAVPPLSIERLLSLYDAGVLTIEALGSEYKLEHVEHLGRWRVTKDDGEWYFDRLVDARGQNALGQGEFPFPTLRMQIRAQAIARSESWNDIVTGQGFELGQAGNPLERVYCLSLPFLLDRNPFVQGLTAAEELGTAAAHALLEAQEAGNRSKRQITLEEVLATLGGGSIYLFANQGVLVF